MKELEIRMMPEKILFRKKHMVIVVSAAEKYQIPFSDIVWAYIRTGEDETGESREPELAEITEDTEGELILYDSRHIKWVIRTDKTGRQAGSLLKELCIHAPYIAAGGQDWFDLSEEPDFGMIEEMVSVMRECSKN